MDVLDLLVGKKMRIMTDMNVEVDLEIKEVKDTSHSTTRQITPHTRENDWWGESETTQHPSFTVTFTNGATKKFGSLNEIKVL